MRRNELLIWKDMRQHIVVVELLTHCCLLCCLKALFFIVEPRTIIEIHIEVTFMVVDSYSWLSVCVCRRLSLFVIFNFNFDLLHYRHH
ncbi:hypothetical protein VNO80_06170 [Phaseolus coccineus]|uniref:Uncharacterized protein n=1 Tax=Phaseolus coccineus TaxID=3886 RepID=A0AAN9RIQ6_PHACN